MDLHPALDPPEFLVREKDLGTAECPGRLVVLYLRRGKEGERNVKWWVDAAAALSSIHPQKKVSVRRVQTYVKHNPRRGTAGPPRRLSDLLGGKIGHDACAMAEGKVEGNEAVEQMSQADVMPLLR